MLLREPQFSQLMLTVVLVALILGVTAVNIARHLSARHIARAMAHGIPVTALSKIVSESPQLQDSAHQAEHARAEGRTEQL